MSPKEKYEKWGISPYSARSFYIYEEMILYKIEEGGVNPSEEDEEKREKDWDSMNLYRQ